MGAGENRGNRGDRGGLGAVLASKNIKAVAVRGSRRTTVADPRRVVQLSRDLSARSFGPALGGLIYSTLGATAVYLTCTTLFLIAAAGGAGRRRPGRHGRVGPGHDH